jgi:D-serine deaminase-like pyridoxal phosphate-dependent protein
MPRILLANELVDPLAIKWLRDELARDPEFEFFCYVDSIAGVRILDRILSETPHARPWRVLVELGYPGTRTGCRTVDAARGVAEAAASTSALRVSGIAGYEGVIGEDRTDTTAASIRDLTRTFCTAYQLFRRAGLFGVEQAIVTAGGSAVFDMVVDGLAPLLDDPEVKVVLRGGCYALHDSGVYDEATPANQAGWPYAQFESALEIWANVISRPEPELALVNFGKRDAGIDAGFPRPLRIWRTDNARVGDATGLHVFGMDDQHTYVRLPDTENPPSIGDLMSFGVSHPCTTLDKWRLIPLVDDDYNITGAVQTFFQ